MMDSDKESAEFDLHAITEVFRAAELHYKGQTAEAILICKQVLDTYPEFAPAAVLLGDIHVEQGHNENALSLYRLAIQKHPQNSAYRQKLQALQSSQPFDRLLQAGDFPNSSILTILQYDFSHALVTQAHSGPRRELTLTIQNLEWIGSSGHYSTDKHIRFGGLVNFTQVQQFFERHLSHEEPLEIAWLKYSDMYDSKPGSLFIELRCERIDEYLLIHCSSLTVS